MGGDTEKFERSVKLCQLIYDRRIVDEIGFEIRKLLEEGMLIDFQDQNRNKKTAIHLAVEKCDVECVKFLLQFKPSLEVKDGDGKTPVELAKLSGYQNILKVLLKSTFDVVNESYIEVFDYESLTRQKIEAIKSRPTFKVLKLINCPSANDVWVKFTDHDFARTFSESSHLFFIAIETKETNIQNDHKLMKKVLTLRRPMIVQLSSPNSQNSKIYFKDDKAVISEDDFNLKSLIADLRSDVFGNFNGDLLDTKLNTSEDRNEAVNKFARTNALCHRFLKLFDGDLPQIDRITATLSFKGDQSLLTLLDLPFEMDEEKVKLNEYQQDILRVVDDRDYNLLMMAAELNNLEALKLLLRCNCDFNHFDKNDNRPSDICWDKKAYDCLADLIEAGSPYPYHFSANELDESLEAFKRIDAMTEAVNSFHVNIEDGDTGEVKKFISSHPHIKHAYDTNNYCALTVALECDKIKIYSLLLSEGFEPGADDEYYTALDESKFKYEIRKSHRKYFKEAFDEPHLKRLLKMFRLSFGSKDRAKCSTIIRKMFDELNDLDEIIPILKICSLSDKLKIIFDFNCNSVVDMVVETGSRSLGIVYPIEGSVYIGAKNYETELYKVIGALIHELTHYAMRLTYENSCKPYDEDDNGKSEQFENVAMETKKICDENPSTDLIVTTVFSLYKESVWHQELIVRVPQLLAHYKMNPQALEAAERNTPELFHFYREKTFKDIEAESKVLLQEYLISKINKQTGIARKIKNLKVKFEKVEGIDLKSSFTLITSNAPQLTLALLNQVFDPDFHIFVTLEQIAIGNILDKIAKINAKQSSTTLIVDCIGWAQKYSESLQNLPKKLKNIKTIALVMTELEGQAARQNISKLELKTFDHKWDELTEDTKVTLLNRLVTFQGIEMTLSWLVGSASDAMNFFPLGKILNGEDFKIGKPLHKPSHNFYIPRLLILQNQQDDAASDQSDVKEPEVMIISDEAGSGKSVELFEIAKSLHDEFPERWVLFVDLKRHIEAFKSVEDYKTIKTFHDFISDHILKNEKEFDQELFKQMFRDGRAFVLFDGFDEISPNYKDLLLHVLKLFELVPENFLFITTRPQLEADLKGALGSLVFVFKLENFSEEFQTCFLVEYWKSIGFRSKEDGKILSERLPKEFSEILYSDCIGLPLLLRMTAEIFTDPIIGNSLEKLESLNVASIFREFVNKYLGRWKEGGNEISLKENVEIDRDGGILEIHHSIAIRHMFGNKFTVFEVDEGDEEKIARVGLMRYDKAEKTFQFIHETFAEYFVADFIWFHLNRKNRNPSHDCRMVIEILIEILSEVLNLNFKVIHTFLDQTLEATKFNLNEATCQSLAKGLIEVVNGQRDFDIIRESLDSDVSDNIIFLLLSILKYAEKEVLMEMLESFEEYGIALRFAAENRSSKIVSTLCNIITTHADNPKRILLAIENSYNILFLAVKNENRGVLTALCKVLNSIFTEDEIKIMFQHDRYVNSIIGFATQYCRSGEVFNELLSLLPGYFSVEELKKLLTVSDHSDQNCLHEAVFTSTIEKVKTLIVFAKSILDTKELRTFFLRPGRNERNFFYWTAKDRNEKIFQTIIESTSDVFTEDEIKCMLVEKGFKGLNVLHLIAKYCNEVALKELNLLLRKYLSDDELRSLLLQVSEEGKNCFRLAANNYQMKFQVFCEVIGNLLPQEDQTRLLKESSREIDIFQIASENYTGEDVSIETIKYLLTKRDRFFRNPLQLATSVPKGVEFWDRLFAFVQAKFSVDEMESFLIDGESCLHLAVAPFTFTRYGNHICKEVVETLKSVLSVEKQRKIVQQNYSDQKNLFHAAAKEFEQIKVVIKYLREILTRDELKVMLMQRDSHGKSILFYLTDSEAVNTLNAFLREILSNDEIKSLLLDEAVKT